MGWQGTSLGDVERLQVTMRIAFIDTYYPEALKAMPLGKGSYQEELDKVLAYQFGTADFLSREFRKLGWEAVDIIANHADLQERWFKEHGQWGKILVNQIHHYRPDVTFLQDLNLISQLARKHSGFILTGQLSCPWPGDAIVKQFDILYSSFPHYIPRIEKLGVKAVFMPLAFGPDDIWEYFDVQHSQYKFNQRPYDCVFIGGVGTPSHWLHGMDVLNTVASRVPEFKWWGYGLSPHHLVVLHEKYQGQAWGRDMYDILLRSKIVINRHGEVSEGYANNMRLFEATGCGALLLTEAAPNLSDYFASNECVTYSSPQDAVMKIKYYLEHESERAAIAARGQKRTLRNHTYANRVPKIAEVLEAAMVKA